MKIKLSERMRAALKANEQRTAVIRAYGDLARMQIAKRKPARKHISEKYCGGVLCLPGLNGKCVACSEDE